MILNRYVIRKKRKLVINANMLCDQMLIMRQQLGGTHGKRFTIAVLRKRGH